MAVLNVSVETIDGSVSPRVQTCPIDVSQIRSFMETMDNTVSVAPRETLSASAPKNLRAISVTANPLENGNAHTPQTHDLSAKRIGNAPPRSV